MIYLIETNNVTDMPTADYKRVVLDTSNNKKYYKKADYIKGHIYAKATIDDNYLSMIDSLSEMNAVVWTPRKDIFSSFKINGVEMITEDIPYNKDYSIGMSDFMNGRANAIYSIKPIKGDYEIEAVVKDEVTENRYF